MKKMLEEHENFARCQVLVGPALECDGTPERRAASLPYVRNREQHPHLPGCLSAHLFAFCFHFTKNLHCVLLKYFTTFNLEKIFCS